MVKITTQFMEAGSLRENPDVQHTVNKDPCVGDSHNSTSSMIKKQNLSSKSEKCTNWGYKPSEMRWKGHYSFKL